MLIAEVLEAHVDTSREEPDKEVEVEEESRPGCRLMLRHRCDNGDVNLGIAGIPQRVETTIPWSNIAKGSKANKSN